MEAAAFKTAMLWDNITLNEYIYMGENEDSAHTKQGFIDICKGNEKLARNLFDLIEWQSPYTLIQEWIDEGEIDENCNIIQQD